MIVKVLLRLLLFRTQEALNSHHYDNTPCKCILSDKGKNFIEFKQYNYKFSCPFVIYADLEAILKPHHDDNDETITYKHIVCVYGFQTISAIEEKHATSSCYRGEDTINVLLKNILKVKTLYHVNDT